MKLCKHPVNWGQNSSKSPLIKRKRTNILLVLVAITLISIGTTFAFINLTLSGTKKQVITAGNLDLELEEDENNLTITNALPMYDEVGMIQEPFTFRLVNKTANDTNYVVKLLPVNTNELSPSDVKYGLEKDGVKTIDLVSNMQDDIIDSGTIKGNQTINYTLRLWIKDDVTDNSIINEKNLSYKIEVEASQEILELDEKGCLVFKENEPNVPELASGMIPVTYDETAKTWKKADTTSKWYDYSNQIWANAVTVTETNRSTYLNASPGTAISMDDINTMWVWIPRYSYTISQLYGRKEQKCSELGEITLSSPNDCYKIGPASLIKEALDKCKGYYPGVVTEKDCVAAYQNVGAPFTTIKEIIEYYGWGARITIGETYPDNIVNIATQELPGAIDIKFISENQKDNGSGKCEKCAENWVTPEGFTFGDEELSGFWMGKFETSTLENCDASTEYWGCNLTTLTPQIKPNVTSWGSASISTFFSASRSMQKEKANIYGFDSKSTTLDTHVLKNTEWGIVAYLSQSKYGKYENPNYSGINKEVYQNKTGTAKTGQSNGTPGQEGFNVQVSYDIPDTGYGASTTGTIYGVYDMSGGKQEIVMGIHNNIIGSSGFDPLPESKYYDLYTETTTSTGYKSGDATYETREWYGDVNYYLDAFYIRGGYYLSSTSSGVFFNNPSGGGGEIVVGMRLALKP